MPHRSICQRCGAHAPISHQSTFCKVTGESDVTMHWCCPPDGCQLDNPEFRAALEECRTRDLPLDPQRGGVVLMATRSLPGAAL